jgi:hypothetical protein
MNDKNNTLEILDASKKQHQQQQAPQKKPNEVTGLNIEARLKIFDPASGEIILEGRG